jgi:hypothetical protein
LWDKKTIYSFERQNYRLTSTDVRTKFQQRGRISQNFGEKIKVTQGNPLSTVLFNIVLEAVFRCSEIHTQGIIYLRKQQAIAYPDLVALITRSKKETEKAFSKWKKLRGVID